ncbi:MAG: Ig-like domain-containing protein, partial [Pirellulales bacterium]
LRYDPTSSALLKSLGDGDSIDDSFQYTVSDGQGGVATATVTVTVTGVNDDPVAVGDAGSTDEKRAVDIRVLLNDHDPDSGDTLRLDGFATTSQRGATITLKSDGILTYNPTTSAELSVLGAGATLTDTFGYSINDDNGGTALATVTITVTGENDPPLAVPDTAATDADQDIDIDVLANDTDPDDGDTLAIDSVDATSDKGASVVVNPDGTLRYAPSGSAVLGQLAEDEPETDTFSYMVTDGTTGATSSTTVTVTIRGVNDDPQANDDAFTVAEGSDTAVFEVLANDSTAPDVGETLTIVGVSTGSQGGTVEITAGGGAIDYAPAAGFDGIETFTYTVSDGNGGTDQATVTVTVEAVPDLVQFRLETTDADGNPLGTVSVASTFQLRVWVQDIQPEPRGVFAAYLDVTYDDGMISIVDGLTFDVTYSEVQRGDPTQDGLIDEVGGVANSISPIGENEFLLVSQTFLVGDVTGDVVFEGNPSDFAFDAVLIYDRDGAVPDGQIRFVPTTVTIVSGTAAMAADEGLAAGVSLPLIVSVAAGDGPSIAAGGAVADQTTTSFEPAGDPLLGDQPTEGGSTTTDPVPFYGASGGRVGELDTAVDEIAADISQAWDLS